MLDFGGGGIDGLDAGPDSLAMGVYAVDRNNISIRNGTIRGFTYGIGLENTAADFSSTVGHVISNMVLDQNRSIAIEVRGVGTVLRNNKIQHTHSSDFGSVIAVMIFGPGAQVQENDITNTSTALDSTDATGIRIFAGPGCTVEANHIVNTTAPYQGGYGVLLWNSSSCVVSQNTFENRKESPLGYGVFVINGPGSEIAGNTYKNVIVREFGN